MTLREELEILRGEPIRVFTGDPMDIPCVETSDPEKLCKHPVVSVNMITYNHEPYIRQAIEGVMMQQTDFEFELVIGEDCSTDKTREICFEYQKRYPDKIRVLWCDHNLYRDPHSAGGNAERNMAHCRGEFIAFCEGDDYWIDPQKLQKQVDAMRGHPSVGLCFCGARTHFMVNGKTSTWEGGNWYRAGVIDRGQFSVWYIFGGSHGEIFGPGPCGFLMTASLMIRKSVFQSACVEEPILTWRLALGDATLILSMASRADVYFLQDVVSVYRQTATGACNSNPQVGVDCLVVRWYFAHKVFGLGVEDTPHNLLVNYYWAIVNLLHRFGWSRRVACAWRILMRLRRSAGDRISVSLPIKLFLLMGAETEFVIRCVSWWLRHCAHGTRWPQGVQALYRRYGEAQYQELKSR